MAGLLPAVDGFPLLLIPLSPIDDPGFPWVAGFRPWRSLEVAHRCPVPPFSLMLGGLSSLQARVCCLGIICGCVSERPNCRVATLLY